MDAKCEMIRERNDWRPLAAVHQIPRPLAAGKAVGRLTPLLVGRLHGRKLSLILIRNDLRSCLAVWRQGVINEGTNV